MKEKIQQNSREKISSHKFLHFYRNRVMNVLVLLVSLLYFIFRMAYVIPQELQRCYDLLSQNVEAAQKYQEYGNDINELNLSVQDQDYLSACNLFIHYIESGYGEQECIDSLNSISDDYDSVFYLKSDGTLLSYTDRPPLSLTEEEKTQLLNDGSLQHDGDSTRYFALKNGEDAMIVRIDESCAEQITIDVLQLLSLDGFIYNEETLDVKEADEDSIPANVGSMFFGDPIEAEGVTDSLTQIRLISLNKSGIGKYTGMKLAAIQPLSYQNEGYCICAYIPLSEIVCNILVKSGLPTFLCLIFINLSIIGSLHFRQLVLKRKGNEDNGRKEKKKKIIRLPFHCFIDVKLAKSILFMQFFMGLLVVICSVVLLTLSRFSLSYENAEYNLEQLGTIEKTCQEALDECWNVYSSPVVGMAETVTGAFMSMGDVAKDEDVQSYLQYLTDSTFLVEISVYDEDGNNIYTTNDGVGYPLTTDPDSSQYSFWSLMNGDREYIITRSDSRDGIIYCAMKRSDAVGIVVLAFSDQGFSALEEKLSAESIMANFYYSSSCLFVDKNADSETENTGYRISSDGTKTSCETPNLPVLTEKETFCGFRNYGNQQYLVVGLGEASRSAFFFEPVSKTTDGLWDSIATYVAFLLVICLLSFIGCAVYTEETTDTDKDAENPKKLNAHRLSKRMMKRLELSDKMEESQKKIWKHGIYSTIILIAVILLLDLLLNEYSMLAFLLGEHWEKGINLFALTKVLLIIVAAYLLLKILRFFFEGLIKNFPLRFATVIQMVRSILNIVIVIIVVVCCANEVGIDTTTILASVGISGLALGIAAKDTINDLLNGLFIILDGRIRVGDWVKIGDFYGEIVKIGIRTTKIKQYNIEKSINNSDMNNLMNLSKGESGVNIKFQVKRGTDLESLKQLLNGSMDRFQDACGGKLKGRVHFLGVEDFNGSGINVSIYIACDEKERINLTKKCNQALIELLDENAII